uniref:PGG domain-containing protein n=1 Tax=Kalanchoe fedtschenkoi TaxID=63787 RepID=A0A7N0TSN8_KALFE
MASEHQPAGSSGIVEGDKIIEGLYESAYSGKWTNEGKKFFEKSPQDRQHYSLNQLVALNIAATVSKWDFIADMLAHMEADERRAVLTRPNNVKLVRNQTVEYLTKKDAAKDYPNLKKRLDGSPEALLLAAAFLRQFRLTYIIAAHINIKEPEWSGPLLYQIISAGFYDVALFLCKRYPQLSVAPTNTMIVEGILTKVTKLDTWGELEDLNIDILDDTMDYEKAAKNSEIPITTAEIPITEDSKSRPTILQVLATRNSAFRSCSRHGGGFTRSLVTWVFYHRRVKPETLDFMARVKYRIVAVLLRFLLPLWIILAQTAAIFIQLWEEAEMHHLVEQLLDIIREQIRNNKNLYLEEYREELRVVIKTASKKGILETVDLCLDIFPSLIWVRDGKRHILRDAIEFRHEKVFNFIRDKLLEDELQTNNWVIFQNCDDIMLLAAKLPSEDTLEHITGSALQVQRELNWFEEVENVAFALNYEKAINNKDEAHSKFVENRKTLVQMGEKWMKDTATSCSVVAALIVTVVYQAVFQLPGGIDKKNKGIANLLEEKKKTEFIVFATSDIVSLFFSSTSLLMYVSILTSRFSAKDFNQVLPGRLILASAALFIGLAAMLTSFTATILIVLGSKMKLLKYITLGAVALPVTLVTILQLPLFFAVVKSTYFGRCIFKPKAKGQSCWDSLMEIYDRALSSKF